MTYSCRRTMFVGRRHTRTVIAAAFLAQILPCAASAQQYAFKHYSEQNGLTNLSVHDITQDSGGYLWVGTDNGLFRYQGRRFVRYGKEEGLPRADVYSLRCAGGAVWAGTPGGISYFEGERFHALPLPREAGLGTNGFALTPDGRSAYYGTTLGLVEYRQQAGTWSVRFHKTGEVGAVAVDRNGAVWFSSGTGLFQLSGDRIIEVGGSMGLPPDQWGGILIDGAGSVWVRSSRHLFERHHGTGNFTARDSGLPSASTPHIRPDPVYGLAISTDAGLALGDGAVWNIVGQHNGLLSDSVTSSFRDREGSLWIGLGGAGLDRWIGEGAWENWTRADGLMNDVIWGVDEDRKGNVWAGTNGGVVLIDRRKSMISTWTRASGLPGDQVRSVLVDPNGLVWIATSPGGLSRLDPVTNRITNFGRKDGIATSRVRRLLRDGDTLWVLANDGLFRSSNPLTRHPRFVREQVPGELADQSYMAAVKASDGTIWFGSSNGIYRYKDGSWRRYSQNQGLRSNAIYSLALLNDELWVAYANPIGLTIIGNPEGNWQVRHMTLSTGLPTDEIYALGTQGGAVWAGTDTGVLRLSGISWRLYKHSDGLVWQDCDAYGILGNAGGVWISTSRGLSHFQPETQLRALAAPQLRYVGSAKQDHNGALVLPWASRTASFAWADLNFRDEDTLSYQFQIEGSDQPWTVTNETAASIPGLPTGKYRIRLRAVNADRQVSPETSLAFEIKPPWWGSAWFRTLGAAGVLACVFLLFWARSRRFQRERRRLQAAVAARTHDLEIEKQRAERERERAEIASRHKGEFLANMSHEIRTPLNGIFGMTELLLETPLTNEQVRFTETVRSCGDHLLGVINNILDFAKIESGRMETEAVAFNLNETLQFVIAISAPAAAAKEIGLRLEYNPALPLWFTGDVSKIRQIALNFISNAIKFTSAGAVIVRIEPAENGCVRISVQDSGCGIAPEKIPLLFQEFVQADASTARRYGGTGLGLAISKRFAELMRGKVGVESESGRGSTFWLELPLDEAVAPEQQSRVEDEESRTERPRRILVADDNPVNQRVAASLLQKLGCEVTVAGDGSAAVHEILNGAFDAAFVDIQMPGMDGYEVAIAVRSSNTERRSIPIAALTANATAEDRERCFQSGMNDFLTKPFTKDQLQSCLRRLLSSQQAVDYEDLARISS